MIDFLTEEGKCEISELEMNLLVLTLNQLKIRIQQIVSGVESSNRSDFWIQDFNFYIYRYQNIATINWNFCPKRNHRRRVHKMKSTQSSWFISQAKISSKSMISFKWILVKGCLALLKILLPSSFLIWIYKWKMLSLLKATNPSKKRYLRNLKIQKYT